MLSAALFRAVLASCRRGGVRGVFLTKYRDQLPEVLPSSVVHCEFAPFKQLFPCCAAVVHHGGIGTVAIALATTTPQLILPICFDQIDNGTRVKLLGAGDWLNPQRCNANNIVNALRNITTKQTKEQCRAVARRLEASDALTTAAEQIEQFAVQGWSQPRASGSSADTDNHVIRKYLAKEHRIVRVAGSGKSGAGGVGGPPELLELNQPHGVYADKSGTLYIADSLNNRVLKIAP